MSSYLTLDRLGKSFGGAPVLRDLSLAVERGEILALLGPSGSGKTTALRSIAGFETPDAGTVAVEGQDVTRLPPARRNFGMVFQHYALFPHLTVGENVAFGLESRKLARNEIADKVAAALALVDLPGYADRRVGEISGGQQQRVALARALAPEPRVLLLDEPLSNLDPALRERTRRELKAAIRRVGITTVLVTHEQEEAFELGDRVAVLWQGRLQQVGTPEELYERPATRFVATFVGRANVLTGIFERGDDGGAAVRLPGGIVWPGLPGEGEDGRALAPGAPAELIVRPEALALAPATGPGGDRHLTGRVIERQLIGRVVERRYAGPVSYYHVALDGPEGKKTDGQPREVEILAGSLLTMGSTGAAPAVGDAVRVSLKPAGSAPEPRIFPAAPSADPVPGTRP